VTPTVGTPLSLAGAGAPAPTVGNFKLTHSATYNQAFSSQLKNGGFRRVSREVGLRGPAHGRFYSYLLNNIDVVITIIYSQKYVLFEIMYT